MKASMPASAAFTSCGDYRRYLYDSSRSNNLASPLRSAQVNAHKKVLLMLAAHDPDLDPRIHWEAYEAARNYDVTVIGLEDPARQKAPADYKDSYSVLRSGACSSRKIIHFLRAFLASGVNRYFLPIAAFAALTLFSIFFVIHGFFYLAYFFVSNARMCRYTKWLFPPNRRSFLGSLHPNSLLFYEIPRFFLRNAARLWHEVAAGPRKPALVHCNDLDTLVVGVLAKRAFHSSLVYDAHEFWPYSDVNASWCKVKLAKIYEKWLIKRADVVITVNPLMAKEIEKEYELSGIESVLNCEPWKKNRTAFTSRYVEEVANGRMRLLYQGNFAPQRGIEELLEAWQYVDGDKAALFLRGADNVYRKMSSELADKNRLLNKSIFFLDPVNEDMLVDGAITFDVGVIPYKPIIKGYTFCCPNKLSQYMHAGLAVLSNDLPYVKFVLNKYSCGLSYNSNDLRSIANCVNAVADDTNLLQEYKRNALHAAESEFNSQHEGVILRNIYDNLLATT